jgi:hypothetical protein
MIDALGTFEGLISELNAGTPTRRHGAPSPVRGETKPKASDPKIARLRSVYQERLSEHLAVSRVVAGGDYEKINYDRVACAALDEARAICGISDPDDEAALIARIRALDESQNPRGAAPRLFINVPAAVQSDPGVAKPDDAAEDAALIDRIRKLDQSDTSQTRGQSDPGVTPLVPDDGDDEESAFVKRMAALDEASTKARREKV